MLSPKTQTNLKNAQSYFEEHLAVGDYYSEGEQVVGEWIGVGAEALGLSAAVGKDEFLRLCENQHPQTGERLTARLKDRRVSPEGAEAANRRVFFDFTFSPPKSVSIAALVGDDQRIVAAHREAVKIAVRELETFAATRVRMAGANADRTTGNIVAALFEHETSRALDPHLHTHCIVFNATHDGTEGRWKALQNFPMLAAQKYVENVYYHELVRALCSCGYSVENSARGDFRITEVAPELCARFSKRHREINEQTERFLAEHPGKAAGNVKAVREHLAQRSVHESSMTFRAIGCGRCGTAKWPGMNVHPSRVRRASRAFQLLTLQMRSIGPKSTCSTVARLCMSTNFGGMRWSMRAVEVSPSPRSSARREAAHTFAKRLASSPAGMSSHGSGNWWRWRNKGRDPVRR